MKKKVIKLMIIGAVVLGAAVYLWRPAEIPVYVTCVEDMAEYDKTMLDHTTLYEIYENGTGVYQSDGVQVTKADAAAERKDPIIQRALQQAKDHQDHGCTIEAINIILPSQKQSSGGKERAEDHYLHNSAYWGQSSGHNFRYFYITFTLKPVAHDLLAEVDAENWSELLSKDIVYRFKEITAAGEEAVVNTAAAIAEIIGRDEQAAAAEIDDFDELVVKGPLYLKTKQIVLEDTLDKCQAYSYCPWGYVSVVQGDQHAAITCSRIETDILHKYDLKAFDHDFSVSQPSSGYYAAGELFAKTAQYYQQPGKQEYTALVVPAGIELL